MPTGQQYATNVPQTTLTVATNATGTTLSVASSSGWPSVFPFTALLDIGLSTQEPVDVTAIAGTSWTVVRNIDSTLGFSHGIGATVTHADIGRDFREPRSHIDASTSPDATGHDIHGIGSGNSVVGTGTTQTLSGKTIASAIFTGNQNMGSGTWTGIGVLSESSLTTTGLSPLTGPNRIVGQNTAAGPPTSGTWNAGDYAYDNNNAGAWYCTAGGTPGTWAWFGGALPFNVTANGVSSVTFNVPSYAARAGSTLHISYEVMTSSSAGTTGYDIFGLQLNGFTTDYSYNYTTTTNAAATITTGMAGPQPYIACGVAWNSHFGSAGTGRGFIEIPFFNDSTFLKSAVFHSTASDGGAAGASMQGGGTLGNAHTAAITSLTFLTTAGNFLNSTFRITVY